jgi:hypothetical protein
MALQFAHRNITIPGNKGFKDFDASFNFNGTVRDAEVALRGFEFHYEDNDERPLRLMNVQVSKLEQVGDNVRVGVICNFGDVRLDDPYTGSVDVLVIADIV